MRSTIISHQWPSEAIRGNQRRTGLDEEHGRLPVPLLRVFMKRRVAEIGLCEGQVRLHCMPADRSR